MADGLKGKRVLLVEDEVLIALELAVALEGEGVVTMGPAVSADQALKLIDKQTPDCAILDVQLKGGTSFPVADALQTLSVPFVFSSAYARDPDLSERYPGIRLCVKPMAANDLITEVEKLIGDR